MIPYQGPVGLLLILAAVWTWFVWIFRVIVIAGSDHSTAFVVVHTGLASLSLLLAIPVAWVGWRLVRR